jgi:hypothetical protein
VTDSLLSLNMDPATPEGGNALRVVLEYLDECESPIERQMVLALVSVPFPSISCGLYVQHEVEAGDRCYRIDVAIISDRWGVRLAIECDGHDFHERTKEQAERDRVRDRALTESGWVCLRYTGSEIHRNPAKCANDAWRQLVSAVQRLAPPAELAAEAAE